MANQYVESVIQIALPGALRSLGLDPAPLDNFGIRFAHYDGLKNIAGEANFYSGNVTGLDRVRRKSDCVGPKMARGELTINCTLLFDALTSNYRLRVRNGNAVYNARGTGRSGETLVYVVISSNTGNYVGSVKSFQITRLGVTNPSVYGLPSSMKKHTKILQEAYKRNFPPYLSKIIEKKFVYALGRALAHTPIPGR